MLFDPDFYKKEFLIDKKDLYYYLEEDCLCFEYKKKVEKPPTKLFQPNVHLFHVHQKLELLFADLKTKQGALYNQFRSEINTEAHFNQLIRNLKVVNIAFEKTKLGLISRILLAVVNLFKLLSGQQLIHLNHCPPFNWDEIQIPITTITPSTRTAQKPRQVATFIQNEETAGLQGGLEEAKQQKNTSPQIPYIPNYDPSSIPSLEQNILQAIIATANNELKEKTDTFLLKVKGFEDKIFVTPPQGKQDAKIYIERKQLDKKTDKVSLSIVEMYNLSSEKKNTLMLISSNDRSCITALKNVVSRYEQSFNFANKKPIFLRPFKQLMEHFEYACKQKHDHGEDVKEVFFVATLPKGSLQQLKDKLTFKQKLTSAIQVAKGIQLLHKQNLMHRKVDLNTIFVIPGTREDKTVLGSLDLTIEETRKGKTISGVNLAPESIETRKEQTRAGDIYAFGVALEELFSNECSNEKIKILIGKMKNKDPKKRPLIESVIKDIQAISSQK